MAEKKRVDQHPILVTVESNRPTNFTQLCNLVDRLADLQSAAGAGDSDKMTVDLGSPSDQTVTFSWIV